MSLFFFQNFLFAQILPTPIPAPINSVSPSADSLQKSPDFPSLPEVSLPATNQPSNVPARGSDARNLLLKSAHQLAYGPPLEATIRQRVWVADKTIVGVGLYQQIGQGQGKYRIEMVLPLGEHKSELVQINDGHLAWSSQRAGDQVRVWRVDVMRLDDLAAQGGRGSLPPRLRVIGIVELLDALARDYDLELAKGALNNEPVWIARGHLTRAAEERLLAKRASKSLPAYVPNYVQIALSGIDASFPLMPLRIEYWHGNPQEPATDLSDPTTFPEPIGLWEVTKYQAWAAPDVRRFQFPAEQLDVDPENRTEQYAQRLTPNRTAVMLPERR